MERYGDTSPIPFTKNNKKGKKSPAINNRTGGEGARDKSRRSSKRQQEQSKGGRCEPPSLYPSPTSLTNFFFPPLVSRPSVVLSVFRLLSPAAAAAASRRRRYVHAPSSLLPSIQRRSAFVLAAHGRPLRGSSLNYRPCLCVVGLDGALLFPPVRGYGDAWLVL